VPHRRHLARGLVEAIRLAMEPASPTGIPRQAAPKVLALSEAPAEVTPIGEVVRWISTRRRG